MNTTGPTPPIPPFGDPNQALFNCTGNLSPEVADARELEDSAHRISSIEVEPDSLGDDERH